jgi:hypothetical protein
MPNMNRNLGSSGHLTLIPTCLEIERKRLASQGAGMLGHQSQAPNLWIWPENGARDSIVDTSLSILMLVNLDKPKLNWVSRSGPKDTVQTHQERCAGTCELPTCHDSHFFLDLNLLGLWISLNLPLGKNCCCQAAVIPLRPEPGRKITAVIPSRLFFGRTYGGPSVQSHRLKHI